MKSKEITTCYGEGCGCHWTKPKKEKAECWNCGEVFEIENGFGNDYCSMECYCECSGITHPGY